ncbi:uncharacterized protein LOC123875387 isoform X2 [Maniola jurtina]|uniref:uncharacterized protein LOC123875387 isoform X2 n=1 Tax=Maniola jurtina TaxID=191418 RepID=UPI001E687232|nr:uncharacterized protein LOC123875387 isoform X2 [Maniola jurtina]
MSGKPYTMKEMKAIVDYLTEHRAYSETKGRKMWMDLASSKVTNRTWQSLKETFLKRIRPDIHNPYYKLTKTQIYSFQQGQDIEKKLNNRLQIRSTSKDSSDDFKEKDTETAGNSNDKNEDNIAGEDPKLSNIRASTETLVLENCYETAEEIRKDLQSPAGVEAPQPKKSMRDLLTFSEPLPSMLQSVIDDFVSEDEEEPKMQIVEAEHEETIDRNAADEKEVEKNVTIEISDSDGNDLREETKQTKTTDVDLPSSSDKNEHAITTSKTKEAEITNEKLHTLSNETKNITNEKSSSWLKNAEGDNTKRSSDITQNNSSIPDTLLPGNQEAFEEKQKKVPEKRNLRSNKNANLENVRKRASSYEFETKTKKRILSKLKSISDSERSVPSNGNVFEKSKFSTLIQTLPEKCDKTSSNVNNEKCENTYVPEETVKNLQDTVMKSSPEIENPCLKNVSLYAEQFTTEKYIDSDTSNNEDDKTEEIGRNETHENIENKNKKENENINDKESENKIDKTGYENKKGDDANDKNSDKIGDTVGKNKKIVDKNKRLEDKNKKRIESNKKADDKIENTGFKSKKIIVITEQANDNITNIENNNKEKIDKNKTHDKNDKPSSKAGQTLVKDNDNMEDDVVILRSHSESVTESGNEVKRDQDRLVRQQRDRTLANMFGFASGGTSRRQRRGTERRKRTISHSHKHNYGNGTSASSDWTSDSGSEYVSSPPRQFGRKGRHTRKYLKPKSAPILSLEEEGGLFVVYNNRIYPVVKDGKNVKNYVCLAPEDDFDQEESFWKLKYVEEKKKCAELTKLINQMKAKEQQGEHSRVPPVQPTSAQSSNALAVQESALQPELTKNVPETSLMLKVQPHPDTEEKTVKFKFTKNNEEVQLEGHWRQLSTLLAHVPQLFQKETDPVMASSVSSKTGSVAPEPIMESDRSTPSEVVEKVNQREREIAQEIERYHKEEAADIEKPPQIQNITKRKGRPRKTSPAVPPSPAKIAKLDVTEQGNTTEKTSVGENISTITTRTKRTPRKLISETVEVNQNTIISTRRTTPRKSLEKIANPEDPDADIRYKFPTQPPTTRKSYTKSKKNAAPKNPGQSNTKSTTKLLSPPVDSSQGYQDSDISPCISKRRRKTTLSFATHRKRYTKRSRQRNDSMMTSDSSNSFQSSRIKTMTFQNSTLTSEIYKSESYRLLMNKNSKPARNTSKLSKILEASPAPRDFDVNMEACDEIAINGNSDLNDKSKCLQINTDDNSSNMSLPTSPVLSIVENISISKEFLSGMDVDLSDEKQEDENGEQITLNHLMTPDAGIAMPLLNQECGLEKSRQEGQAYHYNMSISKTNAAISESLLNKINTVNLRDPSLSETLNVKLKDLLLESAKKRHNVNDGTKDAEVNDKPGHKKNNSKKRSSTPRKRQSKRKQTLTNSEPRIIEEHVESCSRVGRQSCPPVIMISEHDDGEIVTPTETESDQTLTLKPTKGRKKKDIIKIKITKPKPQSQKRQNNETNFSDSGIKDTSSEMQLLQASDDSVDLIHNHSDTCLTAHECMRDSLIVLDDSADSNNALDSNTTSTSDRVASHRTVGNISDYQELFSSDAQDGTDVVREYDFVEPRQVNSAATTPYLTPIGTQSTPNSIMTDDLSDEIPEEPIRNTGWYLLTEDEASNTNYFFNINKNSEATSYGAKLEQLFPVTCAVPDLSTITEMSRENADSKKFSDDTSTRDGLNSPNIFK